MGGGKKESRGSRRPFPSEPRRPFPLGERRPDPRRPTLAAEEKSGKEAKAGRIRVERDLAAAAARRKAAQARK